MKIKFLGILGLLLIFFGYWLSDDYCFGNFFHESGIKTPEDAFSFVGKTRLTPSADVIPVDGQTPRYLMKKKKYVWCDEGAIILATNITKLGNPTGLVDLLDEKGTSHSTILEINQNGTWKTYDSFL